MIQRLVEQQSKFLKIWLVRRRTLEGTSNFELIVKAKQDIRSGSYSEILSEVTEASMMIVI